MVFFNYSFNENIDTNYSLLQNGSQERQMFVIVNCALNVPLSFTAVMGNMAIIYSIWNLPSLHTPSNTLLFGLALCDLSVGMIVQPFYIIYHTFFMANNRRTGLIMMKAFNIIANLLCGVSFLTTTAVSIDRYLAIHLHLRYQEVVTKRRAARLLGLLWCIAAFIASALLWDPSITFYAALLVIAICLSTTVGAYGKMFTVVRNHQKKILQQCAGQERSGTLRNHTSPL